MLPEWHQVTRLTLSQDTRGKSRRSVSVCGWGTGLWKGKAGRVCLSVGGGLACGKVKLEECV